MKTCRQCGYVNAEAAETCKQCGARLPAQTTLNLPKSRRRVRHTSQLTGSLPLPSRLLLYIPASGRTIEINPSGHVTLGRADPKGGADIDLGPDGALERGVSRRHAAVWLEGRRLVVQDLNSANGSYLNGEKLAPDEVYRLRDGDELLLGALAMKVRLV